MRGELIWLLLLAIGFEARPIPAFAGEPGLQIVVRGKRIDESEERAPTSFATVIDPAEHAEQVETVSDALAESVGVQVRRFGGLGAFSTVSIRGSSANQVQVYLDGIPLSRAREETVNLADLPLDSLERIEVYRGTVPVGFGLGGIGGVVNLVTKPPAATPATELAASYGSFDTRKVVVSRTQRLQGVDLLGHVTYLGSEGDFTFVDDRGTPLNPFDDRRVARRNNQFNSVDALLKGGFSPAPRLRLDLTSELFFKDQGIAGIGNNQSRDASLTELRSLNYLRVARDGLLGESLDASGTVFGVFDREDFSDPHGELFGIHQEARSDTTVVGGSTTGTYYALTDHALGWFTEVVHERLAPTNELAQPSDEPDQERLRIGAALQDQASFLDGRLLLVPTVAYEHVEDRVSASFDLFGQPSGRSQRRKQDLWSPAIGAQIRPWRWLTLKGNLGRFQRAPNFSELFGNRGFVRGTGSLQPEEGINRDVGFVVDRDGLGWLNQFHLEYAYFNNDIDDLIVLVQSAQRVFRPVNVGGARVRGQEVSTRGTLLGHVGVETNYTHQDAEDRGEIPSSRGQQLPGRPADELYARLELFAARGKLYYEFNYVSGNFLDRANFDHVPARDTHTVGFSVEPIAGLRVGLEARNITDNQISDVGGFPLPGRSFFGTVRGQL